ncbi:MAG: hypothetical protein NTU93_00130 [Arthrobacter sp.]|nr:hypothetical protein [Arthrobacter sp.]
MNNAFCFERDPLTNLEPRLSKRLIGSCLGVMRMFCLEANHTDGMWAGHQIKRGQIFTGLKSISRRTGLSIQQVRSSIELLESCGELTRQPTGDGTLYTIVHYEAYDGLSEIATSQPTSVQQASNKRLTTSKEEERRTKTKGSTAGAGNVGAEELAPNVHIPESVAAATGRLIEHWSKELPKAGIPLPQDYTAFNALQTEHGRTEEQIRAIIDHVKTARKLRYYPRPISLTLPTSRGNGPLGFVRLEIEMDEEVKRANIIEPRSPPKAFYQAPATEEELREWVSGRSRKPAEEQPE